MNPELIETFSDNLWAWILTPVIIGLSLYLTLRTHFGQLTSLPQMFRTLRDPSPKGKDGKPQSISAFKAFTLSAASRVGVGNIAGVGTAIAVGGPGAVFWMWIMAFLVGATSLIESSLAQLFKVREGKHAFRGGPAYYIQRGLGSRPLAVVFSISLILCFPLAFNSLQANTVVDAVTRSLGEQDISWLPWAFAVFITALTAVCIFGGVQRISRISQTAVPAVALIYLAIGIVVVIVNIGNLPAALHAIFADAWGFSSFTGAGIGTIIAVGVRRGMFSNEAGMGSVPNAAAAAAVTHPVKQGLAQTLGVYFDTWLVCSITAFIILTANPTLIGAQKGIFLTQDALAQSLGSWTGVLLALMVFLLAFTSLLGNYYYGETNMRFVATHPAAVTLLRIATLVTIFAGCVADSELVWNLADVIMAVMAAINLYAVLRLSPIGLRLWRDYQRQARAGEDPVFVAAQFPDIEGIACWQSRQEVEGWVREDEAVEVGV